MAAKLGEMLVKAGKISENQLEEALKNHVIFGGRIGTNLIELGHISEDDLAHFLSEQLGVPCADHDQVADIPQEVIDIITADIAGKYGVIPLSVENKKLNLLMADPSDLPAIDELSFITGFRIKPVIMPEVRLILALEKFYKIQRDPRYIPIIQQYERAKYQKEEEQKTVQNESEAPENNISTEEDEYLSLPPDDLSGDLTPPEESLELGAIEPEEKFEKQTEEVVEEEETTEEKAEETEEEDSSSSKSGFTLEDMSMELTNAHTKDEIADIVMVYAGQEFAKAALFFIKKEEIIGWKAVSSDDSPCNIRNFRMPLGEPSVLKEVSSSNGHYLGPVADTPVNSGLIDKLGGKWPSAVLLLPIMMMGKLVSILYLEGDREQLEKKLPDMQRLTYKTAMAFDILILKNKIMRV